MYFAIVLGGSDMEKGLRHTETVMADETNTAAAMGSGTLRVFSTPSMIALMEKTCYTCVQAHLDEGLSTVGTLVNVKHLAATPVGMKITSECTLEEVDGRRLVFSVKAYDEKGLIGEGEHERFVIKCESFVGKTYAKLD